VQLYPALAIMVRDGAAIAVCAGAAVLVLCLWIALAAAGPVFWIVLGIAAGGAVGFLLLVMHDIVRIVADTLVPAA
jgi:hypothetical protein